MLDNGAIDNKLVRGQRIGGRVLRNEGLKDRVNNRVVPCRCQGMVITRCRRESGGTGLQRKSLGLVKPSF